MAAGWLEMPTMPPTDALYHVESLLRKAPNLEVIHDIVTTAPLHIGSTEEYWVDWVRILAAHRCAKLKLKGEKRNLINTTAFSGYRQF